MPASPYYNRAEYGSGTCIGKDRQIVPSILHPPGTFYDIAVGNSHVFSEKSNALQIFNRAFACPLLYEAVFKQSLCRVELDGTL